MLPMFIGGGICYGYCGGCVGIRCIGGGCTGMRCIGGAGGAPAGRNVGIGMFGGGGGGARIGYTPIYRACRTISSFCICYRNRSASIWLMSWRAANSRGSG